MPRTKKFRHVCFRPSSVYFVAGRGQPVVDISLDELEAMRLVDYEGMEQGAAADKIGVSRGTLQRIIYSARHKVAEALIHGKNISIHDEGVLIGESGCCNIPKLCAFCGYRDIRNGASIEYRGEKMFVAVTYENEEVYQHFGHTPAFAVFQVEDGQIKGKKIIDTNGTGHGALSGFLKDNGIEVLICGGIGGGAKQALDASGIKLLCGVSGSVDKVMIDFVAGTLSADSESNCDHHGHDHKKSSCQCHNH